MSPMPPANPGKMPLGLVLHRANMRLALLTLTMAAYNLTRLRTLAQLRPQCAQ